MQELNEPLAKTLPFEWNNRCSLFSINEDVEATFYITITVFIDDLGDSMLTAHSHPHLPYSTITPKPAEET